jgi:hypothetical protein
MSEKTVNPEMKSLEEWKAAIRRSYLSSVTEEEYDAKATDDAIARVAQYFRESGYETVYFDDAVGMPPNSEVQFLMDFLAFTGNTGVPSAQGYVSEIDLAQGVSLKVRNNHDEVVLVFDNAGVVSILEVTPVVNDNSIDPYVSITLNVVPNRRKYVGDCIHPNVFATDRPTEHCSACGQDVPREQL